MAANVQSTERAAKGQREARLIESRAKRLNLQKILVPLDFSECSRKALEYAIALARGLNAQLLLLHVVEPCLPGPEMTAVDASMLQAESREYGENELRNLQQAVGREVDCKTLLREGKAHRIIIEVARETEADLIIISTHGHSGFSRVLLGNTTELVVRRATCPVLVVREKEHEFLKEAPPMISGTQPGGLI